MQEYLVSFWDHIEDLRHMLLKSIVVIGVGFFTLLIFYQPLLQFLTQFPSEKLGELTKRNMHKIHIVNETSQPQLFKLPPNAQLLSSSFVKQENSTLFSLAPGEFLTYEEQLNHSLLVINPLEGVVLVFKICFWISLFITAPIWTWFALEFVIPGLKDRERNFALPFLICSLICLSLGMAFGYFVTLPIANQYLFLFNQSIGINAWTLTHYVNYVLVICLGHAIAAELALFLFLLVHFRFLEANHLIDKRRYVIVLAFILGALLTPPDVLTQFLLAIPLICLYEIAIIYAKAKTKTSVKMNMN